MKRLASFVTRLLWLLLFTFGVGTFVTSLPHSAQDIMTPCHASTCAFPRLSPEGIMALEASGWSLLGYATALVLLQSALALSLFGVGTLLFLRGSRDSMALVSSFMLILFGGFIIPEPPSSLYTELVALLAPLLLFVFFYVFPNGRFTPSWSAYTASALLAVAVVDRFLLVGLLEDPVAGFTYYAAAFGSGIYAQVYRYRVVSSEHQRLQVKWVVFAGIVACSGLLFTILISAYLFVLPSEASPFTNLAQVAALSGFIALIPLSLLVATSRHRLWNFDPLFNRTLVYGALTLCVIGLYVMVVLGLGAALQSEGSTALSLLATALAAVLFQPLRERLQTSVNRLMYGDRDAPYDVLRKLGDRLEATLEPPAALRVIVETVQESLKVPHVAIRTIGHEAEAGGIIAMSGTPVRDTVRFPLLHNGVPEGELLVAARSPGEGFARQDLALLEAFARQAGNAVYAARLSADLQRARERLVLAREEERRRLRRDLHDELGPALAAHGLKLGSARMLLSRDPAAAEAILAELERGLERTVNDVRRVVHELRPPALDDVGLEAALRELVRRIDGDVLQVTLLVPDALPSLPAAVEAAVYRITQEAVTNVVRHANASTCEICVRLDGMLSLEIEDDGVGLPDSRSSGVGLRSMRERAEELGGSITFNAARGGLHVHVRLPLEASSSVRGEA